MKTILYSAKNNLPLRGGIDKFGERSNVVFLSTIEIISEYDLVLKQHISRAQTKTEILFFTFYLPQNTRLNG